MAEEQTPQTIEEALLAAQAESLVLSADPEIRAEIAEMVLSADELPQKPSAPAILDAVAIMAYLGGEEGGDIVRSLIEESERPLYIHAINAAEIFSHFQRAQGIEVAQAALNAMEGDGVEVRSDLDHAFWQDVAGLKANRRASLAACCGLALARRLGGEFFTTDHHKMHALAAAGVANIRFIR